MASETGGSKAAYEFSDQGEDAVVSIPVPSCTKPADVTCTIKPSSIRIAVSTLEQPEVANGELFQEVEPEECTWSLANEDGKRKLNVTLSKRQAVTGKLPRWLGLLR